ncbi:MAG: hypothetical protein JNM17_26570 [Archangium sp.]|nr:hypothetical protein [Archangium sp.]
MRTLLLFVVLLPVAALAEDCAFELKDIKPQFAAKLPSGFKLVSTRKDKRKVTQVLKTPDGFDVTVELGGCSHVAYSIAIKGGTLTPKTVGSELVAVSKRVLPTLPMIADAIASPERFLKAIEDGNIITLPAQLPCGDATCTLAIEAEETKPDKKKAPPKKLKKGEKPEPEKEPAGVLKLSYDFAL